jgi:hypothetical protein
MLKGSALLSSASVCYFHHVQNGSTRQRLLKNLAGSRSRDRHAHRTKRISTRAADEGRVHVQEPDDGLNGLDLEREDRSCAACGSEPVTPGVETHVGGCLCGGVKYAVNGPLRNVIACHCTQCRKTSGHFAAMTNSPVSDLTLLASTTLAWYRSSDTAKRAFCRVCGSNLFWQPDGSDSISITAGTLETPTHLEIEKHIFVADKSDYYELCDRLPQREHW